MGGGHREAAGAERVQVRLPIERIRPGRSPRQGAINAAYLDATVELDGKWPPLLVTGTGVVIDGHYRLLAAQRLGFSHLDCVIFAGDEAHAYIESVRRNVANGLALTLRERKDAATRILHIEPEWSDRRIASLCGLSHETVGKLRRRATCQGGEIGHLDTRIRPIQTMSRAEKREEIAQAIREHPGASLREIARIADTTHETVRSVRRGMATARPVIAMPVRRLQPAPSPSVDPAFLATQAGTEFAAWFDRNTIGSDWDRHVSSVPLSRVYEIIDEARRRSAIWTDFAAALAQRIPRSG